jgi:two-component system, cell cycle response regulator
VDAPAELDAIELLAPYDAEAALERAVRLCGHLAQPRDASGEVLLARAQLVEADARGRRGQPDASGRLLRSVNRWAAEHDEPYVLARSHRLLAMFFGGIGDDLAYLEHAVRAVELLPDGTPDLVRADHLCCLGLAQGRTGSPVASRASFAATERLLRRARHPQMLARSVNNLAYVEHLCGEFDRAVEECERMLGLMEQEGLPLTAMHVDTVARAYLDVGRYDDAEQLLVGFLPRGAALDGLAINEADGAAELLSTLAEVQFRNGELDDATVTLDRCLAFCAKAGLDAVAARVRRQRSAVLERMGCYQEALDELRMYVELSERLNSTEREVRVRTLQTVYETEEARRSSQRYRDLARRDPLTGLFNRRYVDGNLPRLLADAAQDGEWFSVAFIDLDHFKTINDTLSHDVGDQVLQRFGELLVEAAEGVGFAARMGGEEFLLVLPRLDQREALARCEQLQASVRSHDWTPVTGDLPVRASLGLAGSPATAATQSTLLVEADRNVYRAKTAGRDRLVASTLVAHAARAVTVA